MMTKEEQSEKKRKLSDYVCAELQLTEHLSSDFQKILLEMLVTFDKKQHDYGPGNIGAFGTLGIMVRINDKVERLKNLLANKKTSKARCEGIKDSLLDIANYAIIGQMVEKGWWPK